MGRRIVLKIDHIIIIVCACTQVRGALSCVVQHKGAPGGRGVGRADPGHHSWHHSWHHHGLTARGGGAPGVITRAPAGPRWSITSPRRSITRKLCFTYTQFLIIASAHIAQAPGFRNGEIILDAPMPKGNGVVVTAEFKAKDTEAPQAHPSRKH
jgi:hypothetical protein